MSDTRNLWQLPDRILTFDRRPLVMGIVNVTPDSFSDGGRFFSPQDAIAHGLRLIEEGADLLDIGGESSRPGATPVPVDEELRRVVPVVEALAKASSVPLSIDTTKAQVANACLAVGAAIVNDITALRGDPAMPETVRAARAGVILMHMCGTPATMQDHPHYDDVVRDIAKFLEKRLQDLADQGIAIEQAVLDPGIGFGKTGKHNLELLARLGEFRQLGRPICLGVSRKAFIGKLVQRSAGERLAGSLAAICYALVQGTAHIVRVHDVRETREAVDVLQAIADISYSPLAPGTPGERGRG